MKGKLFTILLLSSAWALVQCGGAPEKAADSRARLETVSVRVENTSEASLSGGYEVPGTVQSKVVTPVSAKVLGAVLRLTVKEGDRVQKGQLLAEIDDREAKAQMAQAEAAVAEAKAAQQEVERGIQAAESAQRAAQANASLAETTHQRFQELLQRNSVSRQEFDEVDARFKASQAQLKQAEDMVEATRSKIPQIQAKIAQAESMVEQARIYQGYSRVVSPYSGVVTAKHVDVGQMASPGLPLVTVEDSGNFEVEAVVPESRIREVRVKTAVPVKIAAINFAGEGEVSEIVPQADPMTRSFLVKVRLPKVEGVQSGLYATVVFPSEPSSSLTVADSAVIRRGQLTGVYVVAEDSTARFRLIKLGSRQGDRFEVLSGIKAGEKVVLNPSEGIQEGSPVRAAGI